MNNNYYSEFQISQQRVNNAQRERNRDRLANEAALHRAAYAAKFARPGRFTRLVRSVRHQFTRLNLFNRRTPAQSSENLPAHAQSELAVKFSD